MSIAVLGGTFDPVHHGHLRLAIELAEQLNVSELRLMPGYRPVHRGQPSANTVQRLQMLNQAVESSKLLTVDDREIRRKGPSYTLLSLQEIRAEISDDTALYFILGEDAFSQLDSWYQWQELIDYAHLLIAVRPGSHPNLSPELSAFTRKHQYRGLNFPDSPSGTLFYIDNAMLEISSTDIRSKIKQCLSVQYLLPAKVHNYIKQQKIYR